MPTFIRKQNKKNYQFMEREQREFVVKNLLFCSFHLWVLVENQFISKSYHVLSIYIFQKHNQHNFWKQSRLSKSSTNLLDHNTIQNRTNNSFHIWPIIQTIAIQSIMANFCPLWTWNITMERVVVEVEVEEGGRRVGTNNNQYYLIAKM